MYLSRIILDMRQHAIQATLGDCQRLHTLVMRGFPQVPAGTAAREHFGVLFRLEACPQEPAYARLLVQSREQPDWTFLPSAQLGAAPDVRGNPAIRHLDDEYAQLASGMTVFFRLRANPTKRISANNLEEAPEWRGKRVELLRDEDRQAWLVRQGERHGFQVVRTSEVPQVANLRIASQPKQRGQQRAVGRSGATLAFGAVLFEGILEVTDPAAFRHVLEAGIGAGKSYGFGLLSIAVLAGRPA